MLYEVITQSTAETALKAHYNYAANQIEQFNLHPENFKQIKTIPAPQGAPIGMD